MLKRIGDLTLCLLAFLLGFSIFLYLPLRAMAEPVMNWGNPESPGAFLAHLLRRQYAGLSSPPESFWLDVPLYLGHVALFEVGVVVTLLAVLGAPAVFRFPGEGDWPRERGMARRSFRTALSLLIIGYSLGILCFLSVNFQKAVLHLNSVFFVPLLLLLSPLAACGLDRLAVVAARGLPSRGRGLGGRRWRWVGVAVLPLVYLVLNYRDQDRSGDWFARDYGEKFLKTLPPGAVYLPSGDHSSFPVLYLQLVEGMRPNVVLADKYGYLDPVFLRRLGADEETAARLSRARREEADRWLIDHAGRPVFAANKRTILEIPSERFTPVGLLYRVDRERKPLTPMEEDRLWASYSFRNLEGDFTWKGGNRGVFEDFILTQCLLPPGVPALPEKGAGKGPGSPRESPGGGFGIPGGAPERRLAPCRGEAREGSRIFYEEALRVDPGFKECRQNYARLLLATGLEPAKAVVVAERSLLEVQPDPSFLKDLARAYRKLRRFSNAMEALEAASRLDPGDPEVSRLLGEVLEVDLHSPDRAKRYYEESLTLKASQPDLIEKVRGKEARNNTKKRHAGSWTPW